MISLYKWTECTVEKSSFFCGGTELHGHFNDTFFHMDGVFEMGT